MASILQHKSLNSPDEARPFADDMGHMDVVSLGEVVAGKGVFEPGWRWSEHVKPLVGTRSCQASHTGYVLQGKMLVKMDDGTEHELQAGDAFYIPPGHDAWTVGNVVCILLDFTGVDRYAKHS